MKLTNNTLEAVGGEKDINEDQYCYICDQLLNLIVYEDQEEADQMGQYYTCPKCCRWYELQEDGYLLTRGYAGEK